MRSASTSSAATCWCSAMTTSSSRSRCKRVSCKGGCAGPSLGLDFGDWVSDLWHPARDARQQDRAAEGRDGGGSYAGRDCCSDPAAEGLSVRAGGSCLAHLAGRGRPEHRETRVKGRVIVFPELAPRRVRALTALLSPEPDGKCLASLCQASREARPLVLSTSAGRGSRASVSPPRMQRTVVQRSPA